jgi:hypothetical protein
MRGEIPTKEPPIRLLHIYGQGSWHDNIEIVGNTEALQALAEAIRYALLDRNAETEAFVTDGEGFHVKIMLYDKPWSGTDGWSNVPVPYSDEVAKDRRDYSERIGPYKIWDENEALNRKENSTWWQRLLKRMVRLCLR